MMADANSPTEITSPKYVDLRIAMNFATEKALRSFPRDEFLKCFSYTTKAEKELLRRYYLLVIEQLRDSLKAEFEDICQERDIQAHLSKLEAIVARQPVLNSGKRCPLPSESSPTDICRAKIYENKLAERDALRVELQEPEKEIVELSKEVEQLQKLDDACQAEISRLLDTSSLIQIREKLTKSLGGV